MSPSFPLAFPAHFPSCPFISGRFPLISWSLPLQSLHVLVMPPFTSLQQLCISAHFPFICPPSFPLYFPCVSPSLSICIATSSPKGCQKHRVLQRVRQKEAEDPSRQRAGRGIRAWDPCFSTPAPRRLFLAPNNVGGYPKAAASIFRAFAYTLYIIYICI